MKNTQTTIGAIAWSGLVLERFEHVAEKYPQKAAVKFDGKSITYSQLEDQSDKLCGLLIDHGVERGSIVGIGLDRSIDIVIAILGIWKAGAAYIPLDPDYPETRLGQILEDAQPVITLTHKVHQEKLSIAGSHCIVLESTSHSYADHKSNPLQGLPDETAYVIFTSGSTGRPKGVQISHGALANFLTSIQQPLQMKETDVFVAVTTFSFDISILEILLPLMVGATVAIVSKEVVSEGSQLVGVLKENNATFLQATPSTWQLFLDTGWQGKNDLTVICGGETFPRPLADELLNKSKRVFNAYGPTETTIWATIEEVCPGVGPVPIGGALENYETHILDENLETVTIGDVGQLYIGGQSLAQGYINWPEETQQRFITDLHGSRLYATGDLAHTTADGKLVFDGRLDTQIKIRGYRVELHDIEAQLVKLTEVKEAVVLLWENATGEKKLVAYIIPDKDAKIIPAVMRQKLGTMLPQYMLPHFYLSLSDFPRTHNNKIDRKSFPAPATNTVHNTNADFSDNAVEAFLQHTWIKVLNLNSIDIEDDFFDLGGDSLQAARITNIVQEWLGELVWPVVIFDAPTVKALGRYLRNTYPISNC
jgi:amino acid adenylation domain-containing protein